MVRELMYSRSDGVLSHFPAYIYRYIKLFFTIHDIPYIHTYKFMITSFCAASTTIQTDAEGRSRPGQILIIDAKNVHILILVSYRNEITKRFYRKQDKIRPLGHGIEHRMIYRGPGYLAIVNLAPPPTPLSRQ
jgi:hypothetical protein